MKPSIVLVAALGLAGCVSADQVVCPDGRVCPATATCMEVASETYCAMPEQLELCAAAAEGDACMYQQVASACHGGVCVAIECGNSLHDPGEACDDGNLRAGDGCSTDCQSREVCGNGRIDVVNHEQCDDGNRDAHDGCAPGCIDESPVWTLLPGHRPNPRRETAMVFDVRRQRTVLFGGRQTVGPVTIPLDETTEWSGARWHETPTAVHPVRRYHHQMAYDAARGTTVLFSGSSGAADTWLWDGATWELALTASAPPARMRAAMTYDSRRQRVVLFGGSLPDGSTTSFDDTWVWTATSDGTMRWTQLTGTKPPPRFNTHLAYDPTRDRIVLYGGTGTTGPLQDLWELDGDAWSQVTVSGGPGPRANGGLAFDPVSQHIVLIGGSVAGQNEVWDWNGATWAKRMTDFPALLDAVTTDVTRGRIVVWSENVGIYELVGTAWVQPPSGASFNDRVDIPFARSEHSAALDPVRRRVLVYGGYFSDVTPSNETLVWDGTWTNAGPGPTARGGAAMAYDRERGEFVMFGGYSTSSNTWFQDTYTYSTAWSTKTPTTVPAPRSEAAMAYDAVNRHVVMFGGLTQNGVGDETWLWNGTNWELQAPATKPTGVIGAAMAYDEERQQIVLFGGADSTKTYADTWIWDGVARNWIKQAPTVTPNRRYAGRMAWDSARRRLVLYGGRINFALSSVVPEVWEWTGTTWVLVPVNAGPRRSSHQLVEGLDGGVVMFQGLDASGISEETWQLRWDGQALYETCTSVDVDGDGIAGCDDADCASVCVPCGNGTCDADIETCASCPDDCGVCAASCGDFVCASSEQCPGDCP